MAVINKERREGQKGCTQPTQARAEQTRGQACGEPERKRRSKQRGQVRRPAAGPEEGLGSGDQPLDADGAIKQGLVPPEGRQPLAALLDPAGLKGVEALVGGQLTAGRNVDKQRKD